MRPYVPLSLSLLLVLSGACASATTGAVAPTPVLSETPVPIPGVATANPTTVTSPGVIQVQWSEAEKAIKEGRVKRITQTHARQVLLLLEEGKTLVTEEPELDDVIRVIRECGKPCDGIMIATE